MNESANVCYAIGIGARRGVDAVAIVEIVRRVARENAIDLSRVRLCAL
jgi:cobalt-precorrin 5A hydrolase